MDNPPPPQVQYKKPSQQMKELAAEDEVTEAGGKKLIQCLSVQKGNLFTSALNFSKLDFAKKQ